MWSWLPQVYRALLPRSWSLRLDLRAVDRNYAPLIAKAEGDERIRLKAEHSADWFEVSEAIEGIETQKLLRLSRRYHVVTPPIPQLKSEDDVEDENWKRGWTTGTWHLKEAPAARLWREIQDARKRRRDAIESWVKIATSALPWLTALVSALVSLSLAGRIGRP
jgi:hypothetical protein